MSYDVNDGVFGVREGQEKFATGSGVDRAYLAIFVLCFSVLLFQPSKSIAEASESFHDGCDRSDIATPTAATACEKGELAALTKKLTKAYHYALSRMPDADPDDRKNRHALNEAERAWIEYRDKNCVYFGGRMAGMGRWVDLSVVQCQVKETAERIEYLDKTALGN